jgi:hypothetical protein
MIHWIEVSLVVSLPSDRAIQLSKSNALVVGSADRSTLIIAKLLHGQVFLTWSVFGICHRRPLRNLWLA